jgi:hypothetical protein
VRLKNKLHENNLSAGGRRVEAVDSSTALRVRGYYNFKKRFSKTTL